jgi:hypothetical protein
MKTTHYYEITVRGRLSDTLAGAFDGLTTKSTPAKTVLCGDMADQAALFAVFERIDSLGLELLDVRSDTSAW